MSNKWIAGAIKRPGALRRKMGVKKGQKISMAALTSKIAGLRKKAAGKKRLDAAELRTLRQAALARTLRSFR